ncbi:MAG: hypothetical protein LBU86_04025, partial [Oscillospiraceae bacterium]|nr:hypothetical protein [Oscillospiraceae bacterium]
MPEALTLNGTVTALLSARGVPADCLTARKDADARAISLCDGQTLAAVRGSGGLCVDRFYANVETRGLEYKSLRAGDLLRVGGALLSLRQTAKPCHDECDRVEKPCPLIAA